MAAYEAIASTTLTTNTQTITFSSLPTTYKHLQLRVYARGSRTGSADVAGIRFNSNTSAVYFVHRMSGTTTATAQFFTGYTYCWLASTLASPGLSSTVSFNSCVADILDYGSTNKNKTVRAIQGVDTNGNGLVEYVDSTWINNNAITSITVFCVNDNFVSGSVFALYGLRSA
jgi:hypothetical protein